MPIRLLGVTYVTLAPEHPLVSKVCSDEQRDEVEEYVKTTSSRSDLGSHVAKDKDGSLYRWICFASNYKRKDSNLGGRLCIGKLWNGSCHGSTST